MYLSRLITAIAMALLFTLPVFAGGEIGLTYNRDAVGDQDIGFIGEYEHRLDFLPEKTTEDTAEEDVILRFIELEAESQAQIGDLIRGKLDLSVTFGLGAIGIRPYLHNEFQGYNLDTIGRTNDLGLGLVVPIKALEVEISLFGRSGNPFAPRTALGILTDAGYVEADVIDAVMGIPDLAEGITIKEGSSLNAAIATEFEVSRFEVEVKGILEVLGEGERAHQIVSNIGTGGQLTESVSWQASVDIATQIWGDLVEYETASIVSLGYRF